MIWMFVACVSAEDSGGIGLLDVAGDAGVFSFTVGFEPDPPEVGDVLVDIEVVDAAGEGVDTELTVSAAMDAHGHDAVEGESVDGVAFHVGHAQVFRLGLTMPGTWTLSLTAEDADGNTDSGHVDFDVR